MVAMFGTLPRLTLFAVPLLAGLMFLRSGSGAHSGPAAVPEKTPTPAGNRVAVFAGDDPEYLAYAIPRSYKTAPEAPMHLLVFRGGLCVRDIGLVDAQNTDDGGSRSPGTAIIEQTGSTARAFVAADGRAAAVVRTQYVSRVDVTPGQTSTANDTVTGGTTVKLVDPEHPDGKWQVTFENSRWTKDVVALPGSMGVAVTTFLPRNGPTDFRILDVNGREALRVAETSAETLRVEAAPEGHHVAAELKFHEREGFPERGVMVFDLTRLTQWTYSWRYGSDAEPLSWALEAHGVLAVKLAEGTRRFDAAGRKL